jgi:hypothetical protein
MPSEAKSTVRDADPTGEGGVPGAAEAGAMTAESTNESMANTTGARSRRDDVATEHLHD